MTLACRSGLHILRQTASWLCIWVCFFFLLFMYFFIWLSAFQSLSFSLCVLVCLCLFLCASVRIYLSVCLFVCVPVCLFVSFSFFLPLFACLFDFWIYAYYFFFLILQCIWIAVFLPLSPRLSRFPSHCLPLLPPMAVPLCWTPHCLSHASGTKKCRSSWPWCG